MLESVRSVLIKIKLQHNSSLNFSVLLLMHLIVPIQNISYTVQLHGNTLFEEITNGMVCQYHTKLKHWSEVKERKWSILCYMLKNIQLCTPPPQRKNKIK